jgi:hypothetical protein
MRLPLRFLMLSAVLLAWPAWVSAQEPSEELPYQPSEEPAPAADAPSEAQSSAPERSAPAPEQAVAPAAQPAPPARTSAPADTGAGSEPSASTWRGPRVELGYRVYSLRDDQGGRTAHTASFSGFLPTRKFRGGGGIEAGKRVYEYGDDEGLLTGNLFAGYQHLGDLGRVVPYLVVVGELGVLFGKRFHTPLTRLMRGVGMELGTDVNLVRSLYVGLGVGFMIYTIDDLAYDSWGLRLSIGL